MIKKNFNLQVQPLQLLLPNTAATTTTTTTTLRPQNYKNSIMFSQATLENIWIMILIIQIFTFLIDQKLYKLPIKYCYKFGKNNYCKDCHFVCWLIRDFKTLFQFIQSIFTWLTVFICCYYTWIIMTQIASYIPMSLVYVFTFGNYDPLLTFTSPNWVQQLPNNV